MIRTPGLTFDLLNPGAREQLSKLIRWISTDINLARSKTGLAACVGADILLDFTGHSQP